MARSPHIQVRETAHGRMLLVDGSCASVWRPGVETTGGTWDLLAAPIALLSGSAPPRALLLGVAGGSIVRVLRALRPDAEIVAVELDDDVLRVARQRFGLDRLGATILQGDARRVVERFAPGRRFDLVIDDVYEGDVAAMRKPRGWHRTLAQAVRRLSPGGLLVVNTLTGGDERRIPSLGTPPGVVLRHDEYHNHIIVVARGRALAARAVGRALRRHPLLAPTMRHLTVHTRRPVPAR